MSTISKSDEANVESIAAFIEQNFNTDKEKLRAAFIWIAKNINYDLKQLRSKAIYRGKDNLIDLTLKSRKAVCDGYAHLFQKLSQLLGIETFIVSGYTKQHDRIDQFSHAWCASIVNDSCYITDPTWGSGYVEHGNLFTKYTNNKYFMASPKEMIKSHMPFDFIWQCLNNPLNHDDFRKGDYAQGKLSINYMDSIKKYDLSSRLEQLKSSLRRVKSNSNKNRFVQNHIQHLGIEVNYYQNKLNTDTYNTAIDLYNDCALRYNEIVVQANNNGKQSLDKNIGSKLDSIKKDLKSAEDFLNISNADIALRISIRNAKQAIKELLEKTLKLEKSLKPHLPHKK